MRILFRAVLLVIAISLILFAVSNRETVSVGFWPLPFLADLPLYLLCFLSLLIGALIGVDLCLLGQPHRVPRKCFRMLGRAEAQFQARRGQQSWAQVG